MDESRRKEIEDRVVALRRDVGSFITVNQLITDVGQLLAELKLRTESYNQCSAELRAANVKREQLERERDELNATCKRHVDTIHGVRDALGLVSGQEVVAEALAMRKSRDTHVETLGRIRDAIAPASGQSLVVLVGSVREERDSLRLKLDEVDRMRAACDGKLAEHVGSLIRSTWNTDKPDLAVHWWDKMAQVVLSDLAQMPFDLPSAEEMNRVWYDCRGGVAESFVDLRSMIRSHVAPLFAAKDTLIASQVKRISELEKFRSMVAAVTPFQSDDDIERHAADIVSNIEGRTYRKELTEKTIPELRARIAELELLIASASSTLPTEDDIRKAWYSGDRSGIGAAAGVAKMIRSRIAPFLSANEHGASWPSAEEIVGAWFMFDKADMEQVNAWQQNGQSVATWLRFRLAPLLAAKDTETERLRSALETKTREWMAATTNGDNLKEQQRRLISDLGAAESRAVKAERALRIKKDLESDAPKATTIGMPSIEEFTAMMVRGYYDAKTFTDTDRITFAARETYKIIFDRSIPTADNSTAVGDASRPMADTTPLGLRQRFIDAAIKNRIEFAPHRPVYFHDLLRLCDVIDSSPCSSAEALTRACAAFVGASFGVDPSTKTLRQRDWFAIGRELKKHLGYEPTVYSDRIALRDGRVWYDYESKKLTFMMN